MRETKFGGLSGIRRTANQEVTPNYGAAVRRAYCSNSQNPGPNSGRAINVFPVRRLSGKAGRQLLALVSPERLPKSRNFLRPFLDLVASGVAVTS
jgi:hypothetical protein